MKPLTLNNAMTPAAPPVTPQTKKPCAGPGHAIS